MEAIFTLIFLINVVFFGVIFVGSVLWIKKTLRDLKAPDDEPLGGRVLDELEVLQVQIRALGDRLETIERALPGPEAPPSLPDPTSPADPPSVPDATPSLPSTAEALEPEEP